VHALKKLAIRKHTVELRLLIAALSPGAIHNPAASASTVGALTEGTMLGKVFAVTVVIGLLVTGSAAFVAKHPSAAAACAVGVLAKPLPAAGCN
jgi:hypothetical protein